MSPTLVLQERRRFLRALWAAAGALAVFGCSRNARAPQTVVVPLSGLPVGKRVRILHADQPVEIVRTGQGVTARSLVCTHMGCEVRWNDAKQEYHCPCHGGVFDAEGRAVAGPPQRPLPPVPVILDGPNVVVGL